MSGVNFQDVDVLKPMPLSVSQRRAAVRQFVADKHGRALTKNGLQLPLFWLVDNGAHRARHRRCIA